MSGQLASYEQWFGRCEFDYSAPLVCIWLKSYYFFTSVLDPHLWVPNFLFSGFPAIKTVRIVQTCPPKSVYFITFCICKIRYYSVLIFWNFWILIFLDLDFWWQKSVIIIFDWTIDPSLNFVINQPQLLTNFLSSGWPSGSKSLHDWIVMWYNSWSSLGCNAIRYKELYWIPSSRYLFQQTFILSYHRPCSLYEQLYDFRHLLREVCRSRLPMIA